MTHLGGNLLLDVGPTHDGSLSNIQHQRLNDLADWMEVNTEGKLIIIRYTLNRLNSCISYISYSWNSSIFTRWCNSIW